MIIACKIAVWSPHFAATLRDRRSSSRASGTSATGAPPMPCRCRSSPLGIEAVHLIRKSMSFASGKDRKPIAQALRSVHRAETPEAVMAALESLEEGHWDRNTRLRSEVHKSYLQLLMSNSYAVF